MDGPQVVQATSAQKSLAIDPNLQCSICKDVLYKPVSLNCGHTYCKECLLNMLSKKPQCPSCKSPCFLQEKSLKENVIIKSHLENTYPDDVKRREKLYRKQRKQEDAKEDDLDSGKDPLNYMVILPLETPLDKIFFPGEEELIIVKLKCDPILIHNACSDRKFLAVPPQILQERATYTSCIFEILELKRYANKKDLYKIKIKVGERAVINQYFDLDLDKEALEKWGYADTNQIITLNVAKGYFLRDHNTATPEHIEAQVTKIEQFFNERLKVWKTSLRASYHFFNKEMADVLKQSRRRNMEYFTNFSFTLARLIRCTKEERQRMFECTNTSERLLLLQTIIDRMQNTIDFGSIIDIKIPAHDIFNSVGLSVLVLVGLFIMMFIMNAKNKVTL